VLPMANILFCSSRARAHARGAVLSNIPVLRNTPEESDDGTHLPGFNVVLLPFCALFLLRFSVLSTYESSLFITFCSKWHI